MNGNWMSFLKNLNFCQRNLLSRLWTFVIWVTYTVIENVYEGLYRVIGKRKISSFIEMLVRPHVLNRDLDSAYASMAADQERESEATEWSETLIGDE